MPAIHATRCVRYRYRYSACDRCAQACPHEAIGLSDEGVAIDDQACLGCALCVVACSTETFESPALAPGSLLDQARGKGSFTIACTPGGAEGDVLVPCLAAVDPATLARLVSQGTQVRLVGSGHCGECVHGARGSHRLAMNLDAVQVLRIADRGSRWSAIELPQHATARRASKEAAAPTSRRHFFRRVARPGGDTPARPADAQQSAVPLRAIRAARVAPSARRGLLQTLGLAECASALPSDPALDFGDVELQSGCTCCEACARACPTGALEVRESSTAWALGFWPGRCVGCAVCVETCQPRVLHLRDSVAADRFADRGAAALLNLPKRRCTRCDRSFITTSQSALCDVCAGDEQDFDALFG